ncbi:alternative ribosome rescue aminoacyl-tRNA hydrolase ArfB [Orrella daihaiensis]|uniref:Aminoacyl-tRNA hydrolase n=1 Tax=Orrella daihaiensis TaxID=2782176 RepID=A0ABY4AGQ2_9BURK|nr:alternative ribosome rescue aminoacyl-tRNA hydrolase ArfB [Orrella daihaiensis]UOD49437.1 aminoacyl-tRNA hydrolase [Orrella daihaiensis]
MAVIRLITADEVQMTAIRAQGPGGQNVNKVSNAVHLQFNIMASALPFEVKQRFLQMRDHHINREGIVTIKSQKFRSLAKNQDEALRRLNVLVAKAYEVPKQRQLTRPTKASVERRIEQKIRLGQRKLSRTKRFNDRFE